MAASGKKNKKNKWKQVDVTTVLAETRPVTTNWADEAEIDERDIQIAAARKSILPTAPRSARGTDDERVPNAPPYVAYITNIPFELVEDDIVEFFGELQVENIRLPRNDATGKLKGYGYVEFLERQGLIEALGISDKSMKGRRIRIEVSENSDRERGGFGRSDRMGRDRMGMGMGRDRDEDPERTMGDWRSGPRSEPVGEERRAPARSGYGSGGFGDREREGFGAPRESDNREGGWRDGMGSGTSGTSGSSDRFGDRDRDRDSFRSRGFGDRDRDGFDRDRGGRYGDRDGDRDRYGGDRPREGFGDRPRYGGGGGGGDRDREGGDRYGDRPRYGDRERDEDRERFARREEAPPSDSGEPRARPKLNLQPRTRPIENPLPPPEEVKDEEEKPVEEKPAPAPAPPVPRASIFGAAKPVDTTAREREIEDRLAREKDRAPRREEEKSSENSKSKEGSDGDETQSKKVEPAPPPKENAWSRRPRIESNNGDERSASPESRDRPLSADGSRGDSKENNSDGNRSDSRDGKDDDQEDNRYNRSGSRDKRDSKDQDISRGRDDGGNNDRLSRKDHSNEDPPRLPKFEEKPIPNFVASNKFKYLTEEDASE